MTNPSAYGKQILYQLAHLVHRNTGSAYSVTHFLTLWNKAGEGWRVVPWSDISEKSPRSVHKPASIRQTRAAFLHCPDGTADQPAFPPPQPGLQPPTSATQSILSAQKVWMKVCCPGQVFCYVKSRSWGVSQPMPVTVTLPIQSNPWGWWNLLTIQQEIFSLLLPVL